VAKVGNNSSPFELLESCPWPGDFECDEVGFGGSALCASGTDTFDCSLTID
jgi:hypothetical protein